MPEMHLIQPGFTSSACGSFAKNKEKIKKLKKKNRRFEMYLSKRIRQSLFSIWNGFWRF